MTKNSVSRATLAAARNAISSSHFFMSLPDGESFAIVQDTGKRRGLPEPSRHGSIANEKGGNFGAGQPVENPIPFQENWPDASTISSHPAAEIAAGKDERAPIPAELPGNHTVLGQIDPINEPVGSLLHRRNIANAESSRNNICKDSPTASLKRHKLITQSHH
jgi:hypothetical protein